MTITELAAKIKKVFVKDAPVYGAVVVTMEPNDGPYVIWIDCENDQMKKRLNTVVRALMAEMTGRPG